MGYERNWWNYVYLHSRGKYLNYNILADLKTNIKIILVIKGGAQMFSLKQTRWNQKMSCKYIFNGPRFLSLVYLTEILEATGYQRWGIVRSAKRCRWCLLGLTYSASLNLESQNLTQCSVYCAHCTVHNCWGQGLRIKFWDSCLSRIQQAKIQMTTSLFWSHKNTTSLIATDTLIQIQIPLSLYISFHLSIN